MQEEQMKTIHRAWSIEKINAKRQLMHVNQSLLRKKQSIEKLESYRQSYLKAEDISESKSAEMFKNDQAFYLQLHKVILAEKYELSKIESNLSALMVAYQNIDQKIKGLEEHMAVVNKAHMMMLDKKEDQDINDLYVLKERMKNTWKT